MIVIKITIKPIYDITVDAEIRNYVHREEIRRIQIIVISRRRKKILNHRTDIYKKEKKLK